MADLEYSVENGVGTILLNRPEKKNAFTTEMLDEWSEILVEVRTDDGIGAIILTGAGDAFCSGGDFESLSPDAKDDPTPYDRKVFLTDHVHRIAYALEDLDKPVIAAINGVAVGAGLDFALMCDMRFMARSARVSRIRRPLEKVPRGTAARSRRAPSACDAGGPVTELPAGLGSRTYG